MLRTDPATVSTNTVELMELICKDYEAGMALLDEDENLERFIEDKENFPILFIKLCEEQPKLAAKFLIEARFDEKKQKPNEKKSKLVKSITEHFGARSFWSQILSFYDKFGITADDYFSKCAICEHFINEDNLLKGDDANENLLTICKSKIRAEHLSRNILMNIFRRSHYQNISFATLIKIGQMHHELAKIFINAFIKQMLGDEHKKAEYLTYIEQLIPSLSRSAEEGDLPSKLTLAKLLFSGGTSLGQDREQAMSYGLEVFENEENDDELKKESRKLLISFADSYRDRIITDNEAPMLQAYVIYQRLNAADYLQKSTFIFELGEEFVGVGNLDKAFALYSNLKMPNFPELARGLWDFNEKRLNDYRVDLLHFAKIKISLANIIGTILSDPSKNPGSALSIAQYCLNTSNHKIGAKLLIEISKVVPIELQQQFSRTCYELAQKCIEDGLLAEAYTLFMVIKEYPSYRTKVKNYLLFGREFNYNMQKDGLTTEEVILRKEYYESAYITLMEIQEIYQKNYFQDAKLKEMMDETSFLARNLNQELLCLTGYSTDKNAWNKTRLSLPAELSKEIKAGLELKDSKQVRSLTLGGQRIKQLKRFGLLPDFTKPRARPWLCENGTWVRRPGKQ